MGRGLDYLGRYRLLRLIRAGQTCQVWEAIADLDRKRVALKVLQPELRKDRQEIAYLKHEYEVGKQLANPCVIEILEYSSDKGVPFLVMEFSGGKNMKFLIRHGAHLIGHLTPKIIRTSGQGMAYMHEKGWVHRDIKPDNFMITDDGASKLIDFALAVKSRSGLAKLLGRSKVQGTRSYMAPEQIRGQAVDTRSDIYSFGCTIFELVTARTPFTGVSPDDLLMKHLNAPAPAANTVNNNVTQEFTDLLLRMMDKLPEKRPASMTDLLREFDRMRVFKSVPKKPKESAFDITPKM